jgi:hypothetical protein
MQGAEFSGLIIYYKPLPLKASLYSQSISEQWIGVNLIGFNVIASGAKQSHPLLDIYDRGGIASSSAEVDSSQ